MKIIQQLKVAIMIVVPVLILVIIRSVGTNHFKPDTIALAESSVVRSNLISYDEMATLSGDILLINLDDTKVNIDSIGSNTEVMNIAPDAILEKSNFKKISGYSGSVVLFSSDPSGVSRMWMFLSQICIKILFILTNEKDSESFKYKFQPDTMTRPEL
jgi:hypothetical protein